MCHTESVFGSVGPRRFRSSRLIFRSVPTNRYPPTVFTLLTFFRSSGRFDCLFNQGDLSSATSKRTELQDEKE